MATSTDELLIERMAGFHYDPFGFVVYSYPWKTKGTDLEKFSGPVDWQQEDLKFIGKELERQAGDENQIIRLGRCSGHGIGKTALIAMILDWGMSTSKECRGILTAGTYTQLIGKTWPEIAKWHRMCITNHWFELTKTSMACANEELALNWRIDVTAWNKNRPEAIAGMHNAGKRLIIVYDEGSSIDDIIYQTQMGALTDKETEIIWLVFGNGTRNTGYFREIFGKYKHLWNPRQIDARHVEITNKKYLQELIDTYGEDSNIVRVRVKGGFPKAGDLQFIPSDWVFAAQKRENAYSPKHKIVAGIDYARGGEDDTVVRIRQGMETRGWKPLKILGSECHDSHKTATVIADYLTRNEVEISYGDAVGIGGPINDVLRNMKLKVIDVGSNNEAMNKSLYANRGVELWAKMKEAIRMGLCIDPNDNQLAEDLTNRQFDSNASDKLILERKDDMKARGLHSPDDGDALSHSFADLGPGAGESQVGPVQPPPGFHLGPGGTIIKTAEPTNRPMGRNLPNQPFNALDQYRRGKR